eukprot:TRINITY_DN5361_c0_g3_i1.p1 TRINITY_DN5361_c0_g3~~TRINITY_DN5361_c0_g3_i1.p1  ORF type:complete len:109 (+),score=16.36 TRINITY_DN5361_c0_g3_i1:186-512(+)
MCNHCAVISGNRWLAEIILIQGIFVRNSPSTRRPTRATANSATVMCAMHQLLVRIGRELSKNIAMLQSTTKSGSYSELRERIWRPQQCPDGPVFNISGGAALESSKIE